MDGIAEDAARPLDAPIAHDVTMDVPSRDVANANRCSNPMRANTGMVDALARDGSIASQDAGRPDTIGRGCGCRTSERDNTPVSSFGILVALFGALTVRARRRSTSPR
jgi:MYXO-CTERM domain-containing protein